MRGSADLENAFGRGGLQAAPTTYAYLIFLCLSAFIRGDYFTFTHKNQYLPFGNAAAGTPVTAISARRFGGGAFRWDRKPREVAPA